MVDYLAIKDVSCSVSSKFSSYLTPIFFLKFPVVRAGMVSLKAFVSTVREKTNLARRIGKLRSCTLTHDMGEVEIEEYISRYFLPIDLDLDLYLFYMHACVRRVMFVLDYRRSGRVSISDFLTISDPPVPYDSFLKLYTRYLELDTDGNGMLTREELMRYPSAILSGYAVERIYQEHDTFENEMDFKGYLDFVFVLENPAHPSCIRYVWKLLDTNKSGKVGFSELQPFHACILNTLSMITKQPTKVAPIDLFHETLDALQIHNRSFFTLNDMLTSPSVSAVMSMLLDAHAFYLYDNRESTPITCTMTL